MIEPDIRDPATGARVRIVHDIDEAGRERPTVGAGPRLIIPPATLPTPTRAASSCSSPPPSACSPNRSSRRAPAADAHATGTSDAQGQ